MWKGAMQRKQQVQRPRDTNGLCCPGQWGGQCAGMQAVGWRAVGEEVCKAGD